MPRAGIGVVVATSSLDVVPLGLVDDSVGVEEVHKRVGSLVGGHASVPDGESLEVHVELCLSIKDCLNQSWDVDSTVRLSGDVEVISLVLGEFCEERDKGFPVLTGGLIVSG